MKCRHSIRGGRGQDNFFFCECRVDGVVIRQWGLTQEEAFENLMVVLDIL